MGSAYSLGNREHLTYKQNESEIVMAEGYIKQEEAFNTCYELSRSSFSCSLGWWSCGRGNAIASVQLMVSDFVHDRHLLDESVVKASHARPYCGLEVLHTAE